MYRNTLSHDAMFVQEIKKSRFLAQAASIASTEAALAFIAHMSQADATHNCWAYRIDQQYRFSDDGEPAGTAGKPILKAIDGQHLDHIVVVVTRRFGGTKLGAGGLMRAYSGTAAKCLQHASKKPLIDLCLLRITCDFQILPLLYARLPEFGVENREEHFDTTCVHVVISLPKLQKDSFCSLIRHLTRGRGNIKELL